MQELPDPPALPLATETAPAAGGGDGGQDGQGGHTGQATTLSYRILNGEKVEIG